MTSENMIIQMFGIVDDEMKEMPKHTQAKWYPSELVSTGLLFALPRRAFSRFFSLAQARL